MSAVIALAALAFGELQSTGDSTAATAARSESALVRVTAHVLDHDGHPIPGVRMEARPSLFELVERQGWLELALGRANAIGGELRTIGAGDDSGAVSCRLPGAGAALFLDVPNDGITPLSDLSSAGASGEIEIGEMRMTERTTVALHLVDHATGTPIVGARVVLAGDKYAAWDGLVTSDGYGALCLDSQRGGTTVWESPRWASGTHWTLGSTTSEFRSIGTTDSSGSVELRSARAWSRVLLIAVDEVTYITELQGEASSDRRMDIGRIELDTGSPLRIKLETSDHSRAAGDYRVGVLAPFAIPGDRSAEKSKSSATTRSDDVPVCLGPLSRVADDGTISIRTAPSARIFVGTLPRGATEWSVNLLTAEDIERKTIQVEARHSLRVRLEDGDGHALAGRVCALQARPNPTVCGMREQLLPVLVPSPTPSSSVPDADGQYEIAQATEGPHWIVADADGFAPCIQEMVVEHEDRPRTTVRLKRIEQRNLRAEIAARGAIEPMKSCTLSWHAYDTTSLIQLKGTSTLNESGDGEIAAPVGWRIVFEGPDRSSGAIAEWGANPTVRLTPRVRIHGRVHDGAGASEGRYNIEYPSEDVRFGKTSDEYVMAALDGRFELDVPRGANIELRVSPIQFHIDGFWLRSISESNCTGVKPGWLVEGDDASEKTLDVDLQSPPGPCKRGRCRVVAHVALPDEENYCAGITSYRPHGSQDLLTHVRKSGWFDCGDLLPANYEIEVFKRTKDGLDVIAKQEVAIDKRDATTIVEMTRK
jgi:hypothetical protein